jgi:hypothetical protein
MKSSGDIRENNIRKVWKIVKYKRNKKDPRKMRKRGNMLINGGKNQTKNMLREKNSG